MSHYTPWRRLGGEEVQLLLILNLGTRWGWVVSIMTQLRFTRGKGPPVPTEQEGGWAPEPVWMQRLEKKSPAPVGDRTPVVQSVVRHFTDWATPYFFIIEWCVFAIFSFFWSLCCFRVTISKIRKNRLSGAGQVPDIPDKRSSTVLSANAKN
jgi:hypothetical protein